MMRDLVSVTWIPGPPPGRGLWWVVWRGTVCAVAVDPALINRGDPDAKLLIKGMTGLAFYFEKEEKWITYHAHFEHPEAP